MDHIDELRTAIRITRKTKPFHIDAWVVLPDHIHCIWTLPENDSDYSGRWQEIKKSFTKSFPSVEYSSQSRIKNKERGIWQRRFWEHTIRDELDYQRHMDYLHYINTTLWTRFINGNILHFIAWYRKEFIH